MNLKEMKYYGFKGFENYATFSSRASKSEFWYFLLFIAICLSVLNIIVFTLKIPTLGSICSLAVLIPSHAVGCRRMHDIEKSGWYFCIPFYNLYLASIEGHSGPNQYGRDPKNEGKEIDQIRKK